MYTLEYMLVFVDTFQRTVILQPVKQSLSLWTNRIAHLKTSDLCDCNFNLDFRMWLSQTKPENMLLAWRNATFSGHVIGNWSLAVYILWL